MSNRKESLKKSLGITEYPWSSDDEDGVQQDDQGALLSRRQSGEPRPSSSADMPGTSSMSTGNPPSQSRPLPSSAPPPNRNPAQQQARRDRDMYWSLLNTPRRTSLFSVQRSMHTPAPDLIERPNEGSPNSDIQRILAFKRLSRNCNLRPRMKANNTFYAVPTNRSNQGPSMVPYPMFPPATSQPSGTTHPRSSRCGSFRRNRPTVGNQVPRVIGEGLPPVGEAGPSSNGMASADLIPSNATNDAPLNENISTENSVEISNSDEELEMPCPSTSAVDANNENNVEQDTVENGEGVAQNISDGGMSFEEEIVEIDPHAISNANEGPDVDVEALSNNDEETKEVLSILRNMHERQENVAQQSAQAHGVKRKREGSADINTPYSVKEFNQSLLRLLECPVCLEWMEPPISQCRRGHLVCSRCRTRLASCPVCRTMFSSVRNRAMEGVAEMLRYPCRHGCGREVRLRRRAPHEASCVARKYHCPAPVCAHRHPLPRDQLATHFQSKHLSMLKIGALHKFTMKVNSEQHDNWLIMTLDELFHLRVDIDIRTWGVIVYVAYIGPKCNASNFVYEVTVDGHQNARRLTYTRVTHSDLESSTMSVGRQDCFHLTLDQAVNFLRFTSRNCEADKYLDFNVEVKKCIQAVGSKDDLDS